MAVPANAPPITPRLAAALAATTEADVDHQLIDWARYSWRAHWALEGLPRPDVIEDLIQLYFTSAQFPGRISTA